MTVSKEIALKFLKVTEGDTDEKNYKCSMIANSM